MRYVLIALLLLLVPGTAYSSPRFFNRYQLFSKTWTKTTGWCLSPKWRRVPEWLRLHICLPRRWGAADACLLRRIELSKNAHMLIGHKVTYSKFRYEFMKKKEKFAHGPYVHFHIRF